MWAKLSVFVFVVLLPPGAPLSGAQVEEGVMAQEHVDLYLRGGRINPEAAVPLQSIQDSPVFTADVETDLRHLAMLAKNHCVLRLYRLRKHDEQLFLSLSNRHEHPRRVAFTLHEGKRLLGVFCTVLPGGNALADHPRQRYRFRIDLPAKAYSLRIIQAQRSLAEPSIRRTPVGPGQPQADAEQEAKQ